MTQTVIPRIEAALRQWTDPYLNTDLISAECLRRIQVDHNMALIEIELGYPAAGWREEMAETLRTLDKH